MLKQISLFFVLMSVISCTSTSNVNSTEKLSLYNKVEDKKIFPYKENLDKLNKLVKENNKYPIKQVYYDANGNGILIFGDKLYVLDKTLKIIKTHNLGEYSNYNFTQPIIDSNGNGILHYYTDVGNTYSNSESTIKMENFIPTELKIMEENKYIPRINKESYNNYKGFGYYFLNDNKELVLSQIESFFDYKEIKKFTLETKEKFNSVILNKDNNGIVITTEENNNKVIYKYYLLKNNNIDLNKGIIIQSDFDGSDQGINFNGSLDNNGKGYLYINNYNNKTIKIKKIKDFELIDKDLLIENTISKHINLNENGDGFIISSKESNIEFKKLNNFIVISSEIIEYRDFLRNKDSVIQFFDNYFGFENSINSNGDGFILSSKKSYKDNDPINFMDYTFYNDIYFVYGNNIIK
jgi:hypothetical protein